jgi:hypothetical protein
MIAHLHDDPTATIGMPGASITWTEVPAGPHGGRAACFAASTSLMRCLSIPTCVWQTTTSIGELTQLPAFGAALLGSYSDIITTRTLADLMLRMRLDLEIAG